MHVYPTIFRNTLEHSSTRDARPRANSNNSGLFAYHRRIFPNEKWRTNGENGKNGLWQLTFGSVHCAHGIGSHDSLTENHVNYTIPMQQQHILHKKLSKRSDGTLSCSRTKKLSKKNEKERSISQFVFTSRVSLSHYLCSAVSYAACMHDFLYSNSLRRRPTSD